MRVNVIAEAGQCMEGDVDLACAMAMDAAAAGATHFKVQLLRPETIATETAAKYWTDDLGTSDQRAAFTKAGLIPYDAWGPVANVCARSGIVFCATPFDLDAVDYLAGYGCRTMKIASGDITYGPLLEAVGWAAHTVILSTGASTIEEVRDAIWTMLGAGSIRRIVLLACSLAYPTDTTDAQIRRVSTLRSFVESVGAEVPQIRFEVGYSDHTTSDSTSAAIAVGAGATWLEKHYTWSQDGDNVPDHAMALDPAGLRAYCRTANLAAAMMGHGVLGVTKAEQAARIGARRSVWLARDVEAGEIVRASDMVWLRPATGTPAEMAAVYIGQIATRSAKAGRPVGEAF